MTIRTAYSDHTQNCAANFVHGFQFLFHTITFVVQECNINFLLTATVVRYFHYYTQGKFSLHICMYNVCSDFYTIFYLNDTGYTIFLKGCEYYSVCCIKTRCGIASFYLLQPLGSSCKCQLNFACPSKYYPKQEHDMMG